MRIFFACIGMLLKSPATKMFLDWFNTHPNIKDNLHELRSYAELWTSNFTGHTLPKYGKTYFLDSGAFSVMSRKLPITRDDYRTAVKRYKHQVDIYANFDVIPTDGKPAHIVAEETFQNQLFFEEAGLRPMPVYHKGEPIEYLYKYIEKGYDYICLGGLVADSDIKNESFFDDMWANHLTNSDGTPKVKIHGFGMTSLTLMLKYPWFSVDSQSWLKQAQHGFILIPKMQDGKYNFSEQPMSIAVSERSKSREYGSAHMSTLSQDIKDYCNEYAKQCGTTLEQCAQHHAYRFFVNVSTFINMQRFANWPTTYKPAQIQLL